MASDLDKMMLECLEIEMFCDEDGRPEFDFNDTSDFFSTSDCIWTTKSIIKKIKDGYDSEEAISYVADKMLTNAYKANNEEAREMFMNAYYECDYLTGILYDIKEQLENV